MTVGCGVGVSLVIVYDARPDSPVFPVSSVQETNSECFPTREASVIPFILPVLTGPEAAFLLSRNIVQFIFCAKLSVATKATPT
ncbi:hypothetical protein COU36_00960 [Candidatus Micrarchaeota archaeon CG10_big_fil_rev_8_21_14_0_10_59_7]|nr:MAG: hypothetical protein COU36_00960 [Candidatus Micrarchaeota archaeon CG10_big_fil_rev_8_21_14_0_10_59_7]